MSVEEMAEAMLPYSSGGLRVSIVGVGGAGNNLLCHAINRGISPCNCIAVNTDRSQLSKSLAQNKVLVLDDEAKNGYDVPEGGRMSTQLLHLSAHRVDSFTRESDFTILVAGLGGSIGTGATPLIAQSNRTQARPVVSVVAMPFIHERERRFIALRGLKKMVDVCDCTIVIDNAAGNGSSRDSERIADERASLTVRALSEVVATGGPRGSQKVLETLSLGPVAIVCTAYLKTPDSIQSVVLEALRTPSANLPLTKARGAILLYRGSGTMSTLQAAQAYETIAAIVGHDVKFVQSSVNRTSERGISIFLTGYDYDATLASFVDFIEDLYDLEYGQELCSSNTAMRIPLFQMEEA